MGNLEQNIEALIFASAKPIKKETIIDCLNVVFKSVLEEKDIDTILSQLVIKYKSEVYPFSIEKSGGGYQFLTKPDFQGIVASLLHQDAKRQLTTAALETLAIIAYKQPVTKSQIEQIRGVNSDYSVNKLMEKELVEIVGRSDELGKPLLYGTSEFFMDYFGINAIEELPKIKEFNNIENEIGFLPDINKNSEN